MKTYLLMSLVSAAVVYFTYYVGGNPAQMLTNALITSCLWHIIDSKVKK